MKRFDSGDALAKEFGLPADVLRKTFDDYNQSVRTKKDPFGKKVSFKIVFNKHISPTFDSFSKVNGNPMTSSMSPS